MIKLLLISILPFLLFCTRDKKIVEPSDNGGKIIFSVSVADKVELWAVQENGQALLKLADGYEPDVSPDHHSIIFTGRDSASVGIDIFKMGINDGGKTCLTRDLDVSASYPRWSPDGSQIAFQAGPSGSMENVWVMNADGSKKVKLTSGNLDLLNWGAEWSSDGTRLSYIKSNRIDSANGSHWSHELWMINGVNQKLMSLESPNSYGKWSSGDEIAVISGGALYLLSGGMAILVSDWYVSDFDWTDNDALVYGRYQDGAANLYHAVGQAAPNKLTCHTANQRIYPLCYCENGSVAYAVDGNQLYLNTFGSDRLVVKLQDSVSIADVCWIPRDE
jgi:hypothetical protein